MDIRLIFRNFRTLKREDASRKVHSLLNCEQRPSAKAQYRTRCREKPLRMLRNPYRKPTQVGG